MLFLLYIIVGIACVVCSVKTFINFYKSFKYYYSLKNVKGFTNIQPLKIDKNEDDLMEYYWEVPGFKDDKVFVRGVDIVEDKNKNCDVMLFMKDGEYFVRDDFDFKSVNWWEIFYGIINLFVIGALAVASAIVLKFVGFEAFAMINFAFVGMLLFSKGISCKLLTTSIYNIKENSEEILYSKDGVPKCMIIPVVGAIATLVVGVIVASLVTIPASVLNAIMILSALAGFIMLFVCMISIDSVNRIDYMEEDSDLCYRVVERI